MSLSVLSTHAVSYTNGDILQFKALVSMKLAEFKEALHSLVLLPEADRDKMFEEGEIPYENMATCKRCVTTIVAISEHCEGEFWQMSVEGVIHALLLRYIGMWATTKSLRSKVIGFFNYMFYKMYGVNEDLDEYLDLYGLTPFDIYFKPRP